MIENEVRFCKGLNMVGESFSSSGNDDWKEAAWQRKLRKQSKVKLKRRKR